MKALPENLIVDKHIENFEELKKSGNSIRRTGEKVTNCRKLRETLANCPDQEKYHEDVTGDAGAFLEYMLGLLPVQKASKIIKVYGVHLSKTDLHYEDLDTSDFSLTPQTCSN